jgi:hypothetical protein
MLRKPALFAESATQQPALFVKPPLAHHPRTPANIPTAMLLGLFFANTLGELLKRDKAGFKGDSRKGRYI